MACDNETLWNPLGRLASISQIRGGNAGAVAFQPLLFEKDVDVKMTIPMRTAEALLQRYSVRAGENTLAGMNERIVGVIITPK